jgi:NADH-quinone oxidoreductase subunit D
MEELIQQFKSVTEGPRVPAGEAYQAIESANGELGFYLVSDGGGRPYKIGLRAPVWSMLMALPSMTRNRLFADLVPVYDSINYIAGEVEQ